jgi:hypothetical protein
MRTEQLDPTAPGPGGLDRWDDDRYADLDDVWHPPAAASAALTGNALAFLDRLDAALCDYAAAVATALAHHGLPARAHVRAGCDLATIELTVPRLAATVTDACLRFSDEAGWHYLPERGKEWARLVPLRVDLSAAQLAPPPGGVAAAIAALPSGGGGWATPAPGEPPAVDALAGPWLDALLDALDSHHQPPPGSGGISRAA